jgi:uncharacterized protein YbaR (Trm112 family)
MIDPQFLALLRCPETGQALELASPEQLARVEAARAAGMLRDRMGKTVGERVVAGLVREDGNLLFPIREDIPVLLLDDALPLGAE